MHATQQRLARPVELLLELGLRHGAQRRWRRRGTRRHAHTKLRPAQARRVGEEASLLVERKADRGETALHCGDDPASREPATREGLQSLRDAFLSKWKFEFEIRASLNQGGFGGNPSKP